MPFCSFSSTKRAEYELIPPHHVEQGDLGKEEIDRQDDDHFNRYRKATIVTVVAVTLFLVCVVAPSSHPSGRTNVVEQAPVEQHSGQTIPTLLWLVDPNSLEYIQAKHHAVYEELKGQILLSCHDPKELLYSERIVETPQIYLNNVQVALNDPLILSWTNGVDTSGSPVITDNDIMLLQCNDSEHQDSSNILEAATLAQVRATSAKHSHNSSLDNEWYIPNFPISRNCYFSLYRRLVILADNNNNQTIFQCLASSNRLQVHDHPVAIHWALTRDDPTTMVVNFVTSATPALQPATTPVIEYFAVTPGSEFTDASDFLRAVGTSDTYRAHDLCHAPANLTEPGKFQAPGWLHTIQVRKLRPNTVYVYRVGVRTTTTPEQPQSDEPRSKPDNDVTWSDYFTIQSPIWVGTHNFTYLVYGDQGCPPAGWREGGAWIRDLAAREKHNKITAIHHLGDLSYAEGAAHVWDAWFDMIQPLSTAIPLMIMVGNHEYDYNTTHQPGLDYSLPSDATHGYMPEWGNFAADSGGECGVPTAKRFTMPGSISSSHNTNKREELTFWYSYITGSVHTIVLSSEHDLSSGSPQRTWLETELHTVDRLLTPWLVVEAHRPMYHGAASWNNNEVGIALRTELEDLFVSHQVDLYLTGHYHSYFRTCDGLYQSICNNGGLMHITIGTAGASFTTDDLYNNTWSASYIRGVYGYGRVTVVNATAMLFEYITLGKDPEGGQILDSVWILRDR